MMHEPKLTEAIYTKLLKDVSTSVLDDIESTLDDEFSVTENVSMYDVFLSMYRYYEICDADETVFYQSVSDVYKQHINYYKELYDNYTKEYDYAIGNKRHMERHDVSHSERAGYTASTGSGTTREYDLPNKVVDSEDENGYLTGKNDNDTMEIGNDGSSKDSTYDSEIVNTYDNEFLDLKKKYLQQIRNLFEEFAGKFSDCFIHLFS